MTTLEKINRCHEIIVESNNRIESQLESILRWNRDSFYSKEQCHVRIEQLRVVQERLINYMRKQAMNLLIELGV